MKLSTLSSLVLVTLAGCLPSGDDAGKKTPGATSSARPTAAASAPPASAPAATPATDATRAPSPLVNPATSRTREIKDSRAELLVRTRSHASPVAPPDEDGDWVYDGASRVGPRWHKNERPRVKVQTGGQVQE